MSYLPAGKKADLAKLYQDYLGLLAEGLLPLPWDRAYSTAANGFLTSTFFDSASLKVTCEFSEGGVACLPYSVFFESLRSLATADAVSLFDYFDTNTSFQDRVVQAVEHENEYIPIQEVLELAGFSVNSAANRAWWDVQLKECGISYISVPLTNGKKSHYVIRKDARIFARKVEEQRQKDDRQAAPAARRTAEKIEEYRVILEKLDALTIEVTQHSIQLEEVAKSMALCVAAQNKLAEMGDSLKKILT